MSAENFTEERRQKEHQDREIAPISFPPFHQWQVRRRTGHAPRNHLKGTLHQEPHIKSEDLFMEKRLFPEKCLSWENFSPISCEKTLYPGPHLAPPLALNVDQRSRELRLLVKYVGEVNKITMGDGRRGKERAQKDPLLPTPMLRS